jgi:hypothetical protein
VSLGSSWFAVKLPESIPQPFLLEFNPFFCSSISKIDSESASSFEKEKKKERNMSQQFEKYGFLLD